MTTLYEKSGRRHQRVLLVSRPRRSFSSGAIDLYGAASGLPKAINGVNPYRTRAYGDPTPRTLIVPGMSADDVNDLFEYCELAGHTKNSFNVKNEETKDHPDIQTARSGHSRSASNPTI